ncbi:hypothetical protein OBB02_03585 [Candidatus Puniceispirillum sp.]|nr:hypothetical protein [Candidatus Puniceispirillum sp.]
MFLFRLALIPSSRNQNRKLGFATLILAVLAAHGAPLYAAERSNTVPCNIKLVFGVDDNGMSVVSYDLEMQINNKQGRTIHGVSVHWLNEQAEIIGNSDAACGAEHTGVKLAQSGSCRRTIQKIGGRLLEQLGQETWTSIINSQIYNFQDVRYCAIIGYRFGEPEVNRY